MESNPYPAHSIGEDLWVEILKRLAVKSLCRFQCVDQSWKRLISSTFFINHYRSFTSSIKPSNRKPYLRVEFGHNGQNSYSICHPRGTHDLHFPFRLRDSSLPIFFPIFFSIYFSLVDVIHGIVCVSYTVNSSFDSTILWNPACQKYTLLPELPPPFDLESDVNPAQFCSSTIGFGYDDSKKDFKVVRISIPNFGIEHLPHPPTYEIYSVLGGVWRKRTADINIKSCKFFGRSGLRKASRSCFVNGTIHWLVWVPTEPTKGSNYRAISMIMFDCEREELTTMELPREMYMFDVTAELLAYAGMVAAVTHSPGNPNSYVEMWVMEEHGVARSWKRVHRFELNWMDTDDIFRPSFLELVSSCPYEWIMARKHLRFDRIFRDHAYEEGMMLMDNAKAKSYTKEEIIHL